MNLKNVINLIMPPILLKWIEIILNRKRSVCLSGDYNSWAEAERASTGYDSALILEKTKTALLKVKSGEAIYERDSVIFNEVEYAWPLLSGLMWVAAESGGRLNVLDFGGSLGSTYYQNRAFLSNLPEVQWNIVEQPEHVKIGKEYFEDEVLKFFPNIKACFAETKPNVIILSSVLQYLKSPYEILDELLDLPINYVIIDKTPFWDGSIDKLCVQQVPPTIYPASYPSWIFSKGNLDLRITKKKFRCVAEFNNPDSISGPVNFNYKGMIISRNNLLDDRSGAYL